MTDIYLHMFFFNDTATTEIYTLSLHDALPIYGVRNDGVANERDEVGADVEGALGGAGGDLLQGDEAGNALAGGPGEDRKSTRLNSSHANISYAVFCLKKKKNTQIVQFLSYYPS